MFLDHFLPIRKNHLKREAIGRLSPKNGKLTRRPRKLTIYLVRRLVKIINLSRVLPNN
jgi:hypothetical protein